MSKCKTLVYLEEEQLRALRRRAKRAGRSMAAEVREAVASYLSSPGSRRLEGFVGCAAAAGDDDTSGRADEILKGLLG